MDKLNQFFKNFLLFLVIFMAVNYIMGIFINEDEEILLNSGNLLFSTTDNEYSRGAKVSVRIENNTKSVINIPSECPGEPFNVFRKENNEWVSKVSEPQINCENAEDIELLPGQKTEIIYDNWSYELFGNLGIFKIEFSTELENEEGEIEEKTFSTNEFIVKEEGILRKLWNGLFYKPIYNGLIFIAKTLPGHNLGFAIILLTLLIRTILLVPSQNAMKSQKRLQEIQPRLEKIKKKYKDDQQRIAMETMAIWKEAKVNPFGSCLPLLLQFPFLIALFYVVQGGLNPDNAHLLYVEYTNFTLNNIDVNFLGLLDLTKTNIYVLPLIIGGLQFIQMKLAMGRKKNKAKQSEEMAVATNMMTYVMPVMIAVFTASLPAGVGIYWGTSTIYGIVQQIFVNKSGGGSGNGEPKVKVIEPSNT